MGSLDFRLRGKDDARWFKRSSPVASVGPALPWARSRCSYAALAPLLLATWVAMASIKAGDRQS